MQHKICILMRMIMQAQVKRCSCVKRSGWKVSPMLRQIGCDRTKNTRVCQPAATFRSTLNCTSLTFQKRETELLIRATNKEGGELDCESATWSYVTFCFFGIVRKTSDSPEPRTVDGNVQLEEENEAVAHRQNSVFVGSSSGKHSDWLTLTSVELLSNQLRERIIHDIKALKKAPGLSFNSNCFLLKKR